MKSIILWVVAATVFAGCGTTVAEKAEVSAVVTASGQATIENFVQKGMRTTRVYLRYIDGEFLQTNGRKGVHALAPGAHEFTVGATFSRMTIGDLMIDGAEWKPHLTAEAGIRYRLHGRRLSDRTAEVWIEDATRKRIVVGPQVLSLNENPHQMPLGVRRDGEPET